MAVKPVKVLTDLLTKKQIIKRDLQDNILFNVSGTLSGGGHVSSSLPVLASSAYTPKLEISSSAVFFNSNVQAIVGGGSKYNVDAAIHELDRIVNNSNTLDNVRKKEAINAYKRLRYQCTGTFDINGYAEVKLPIYQSQYDYNTLVGGPDGNGDYTIPIFTGPDNTSGDPNFESFPVSSKDYINVDVMVKSDPDAIWTNDIIAVHLVVSGALNDELWVKIYAPGLSDGESKYRLLAVNEDPTKYIIN